jgi:hypothetical protein
MHFARYVWHCATLCNHNIMCKDLRGIISVKYSCHGKGLCVKTKIFELFVIIAKYTVVPMDICRYSLHTNQ